MIPNGWLFEYRFMPEKKMYYFKQIMLTLLLSSPITSFADHNYACPDLMKNTTYFPNTDIRKDGLVWRISQLNGNQFTGSLALGENAVYSNKSARLMGIEGGPTIKLQCLETVNGINEVVLETIYSFSDDNVCNPTGYGFHCYNEFIPPIKKNTSNKVSNGDI